MVDKGIFCGVIIFYSKLYLNKINNNQLIFGPCQSCIIHIISKPWGGYMGGK